ncbi:hypothetical protein XELAEV_18018902mg [Xenopus laevis]|uniref:Uncharacterized protein n=1 Tax=Xenopus laevis TaxID=8355 RepID=A0A974HU11_XENLA|nr:hypothetical protein XELAEV_18018902mg [Xenopus laevis]
MFVFLFECNMFIALSVKVYFPVFLFCFPFSGFMLCLQVLAEFCTYSLLSHIKVLESFFLFRPLGGGM